jgi:hypothetical protein
VSAGWLAGWRHTASCNITPISVCLFGRTRWATLRSGASADGKPSGLDWIDRTRCCCCCCWPGTDTHTFVDTPHRVCVCVCVCICLYQRRSTRQHCGNTTTRESRHPPAIESTAALLLTVEPPAYPPPYRLIHAPAPHLINSYLNIRRDACTNTLDNWRMDSVSRDINC